jgi:hypothetical protein
MLTLQNLNVATLPSTSIFTTNFITVLDIVTYME